MDVRGQQFDYEKVPMPPEKQEAFRTDRLRVFEVVSPGKGPDSRTVRYLAFGHKMQIPRLVAQATVTLPDPETLDGESLDWLEVDEGLRRKGLGRELLLGIEEDNRLTFDLSAEDDDDVAAQAFRVAMTKLPERRNRPRWWYDGK